MYRIQLHCYSLDQELVLDVRQAFARQFSTFYPTASRLYDELSRIEEFLDCYQYTRPVSLSYSLLYRGNIIDRKRLFQHFLRDMPRYHAERKVNNIETKDSFRIYLQQLAMKSLRSITKISSDTFSFPDKQLIKKSFEDAYSGQFILRDLK